MIGEVVVKALCAFMIVKLVRTFRRVRLAELNGTKPWACDTCMSLWATILLGAVEVALVLPPTLLHWYVFALIHGAGAGACRAMLALVRKGSPEEAPDFDLPDEVVDV